MHALPDVNLSLTGVNTILTDMIIRELLTAVYQYVNSLVNNPNESANFSPLMDLITIIIIF